MYCKIYYLNLFVLIVSFACSSVKEVSQSDLSNTLELDCKQFRNDSLVFWSNYCPLDTIDFQKSISLDYQDEFSSDILIDHKIYDDSIVFNIKAVMLRKESGLSSNDNCTLDYMQLHFDLTEVVARMARISFKNAVSYDLEVTLDELEVIHHDLRYNTLDSLRNLCDEETAFGKKERRRKKWMDGISEQLIFLGDHEEIRIVVPRIRDGN